MVLHFPCPSPKDCLRSSCAVYSQVCASALCIVSAAAQDVTPHERHVLSQSVAREATDKSEPRPLWPRASPWASFPWSPKLTGGLKKGQGTSLLHPRPVELQIIEALYHAPQGFSTFQACPHLSGGPSGGLHYGQGEKRHFPALSNLNSSLSCAQEVERLQKQKDAAKRILPLLKDLAAPFAGLGFGFPACISSKAATPWPAPARAAMAPPEKVRRKTRSSFEY